MKIIIFAKTRGGTKWLTDSQGVFYALQNVDKQTAYIWFLAHIYYALPHLIIVHQLCKKEESHARNGRWITHPHRNDSLTLSIRGMLIAVSIPLVEQCCERKTNHMSISTIIFQTDLSYKLHGKYTLNTYNII